MDEDYRVKSRSNEELESIADAWRKALVGDDPRPDVFHVLEKAREFTVTQDLELIARPDAEMGRRLAYAISDENARRIFASESVIQAAKNGEPRFITTLIHELSHIILHPGAAPKPRLATRNKTPAYIAPHESAEHQARVFTAAFQMPRTQVRTLSSAAQIKERFGVSEEASIYRYREVIERSRPREIPEKARALLNEHRPTVLRRVPERRPEYLPVRAKSKVDEAWEAARTAPEHSPVEYRLSSKGFLVKRSDYLKMTALGWFVSSGQIHAHLETDASTMIQY
jgi:hypothetical protein